MGEECQQIRFEGMLLFLLLSITLHGCTNKAAWIEIPEGYVGWVSIRILPNCPDEPSTSTAVIGVDRKGNACTSRWDPSGLSLSWLYYVDGSGKRIRKLENGNWGEGGDIWAMMFDRSKQEYRIFVGTEADYKQTMEPPE